MTAAEKKKRGKFLVNKRNCRDYARARIAEKYENNMGAAPTRIAEDFYGWLGQEVLCRGPIWRRACDMVWMHRGLWGFLERNDFL